MYLPFPTFSTFFSSLLSSLPSQWRGVLRQQSLEGAGILFFSFPLRTYSPLTEKFQGEFQEWKHGEESLALVFFLEAVLVRWGREGASFLDNPSILANVSDSIQYTVIKQRCILNYLILRVLVFSRLPDVYLCVYIASVVYKRLTEILFVWFCVL